MLRNRTSIYTQFDAQNAGNSVSELPDFKFFWGGMCPDPPSKKGQFEQWGNKNRWRGQEGNGLEAILFPTAYAALNVQKFIFMGR